ncbi:MAG: sugar ABC transporter ATP-binding protein [Anaerolineae bacterium]|nr:sugar ABC transporter ATP-binding protein [Anaerolineae bacterium]
MALKAMGLGKRFPGVVALKDVSLTVEAGQVMALVGANGAGKSTLIKILTGYYEHYEGRIEIDGQAVTLRKPADASQHGIQAVYQEVDTVLVPTLTVTENLLMNETVQRKRRLLMNWGALNQRARNILTEMHLNIPPRRRVESLVLHEKQMLVIARAVNQRVRYLIFDEPTTSLSLPEVDQLFRVIRRLTQQGVGIIYISHRLAEVREIADDITILRGGEKVAEFPVGDFDVGRISEAMLGTAMTEAYPPKRVEAPGDVMLEAKNLSRRRALQDVSFSVRQGEILGIAGLVGAGKTELVRALFGADRVDSGSVLVRGKRLRGGSPGRAVRQGVYLVPEERRSQGVLVEDPIRKNIALPFLSAFSWVFGIMRRGQEVARTQAVIQDVGLTPPNPHMLVQNLSGGNQQKVAIGKWFTRPPRVMIFDEATQGIDVRAKQDVYRLAQRVCDHAAVIFSSSDIDEVIGVANRVIVMKDGRIVAELAAHELDRNLILEYATGARRADGSLAPASALPLASAPEIPPQFSAEGGA